MSGFDLVQAAFRKSSYSEGGNGCVETCATGLQHLVRDSKNPDGGFLALDPGAWSILMSQIKQGVYDL